MVFPLQVVRSVLREAENVQQRLRESSVETISAETVHHSSSDFMDALARVFAIAPFAEKHPLL